MRPLHIDAVAERTVYAAAATEATVEVAAVATDVVMDGAVHGEATVDVLT